MNEYKTGSDFAATSLGNSGSGSGSAGMSPWSSRGAHIYPFLSYMVLSFFRGRMSNSFFVIAELGESQTGETSAEVAGVKKKERRKKPRAGNSSQSNNGSCSSRPSRQGKPKTKFIEDNATNIQVV